MTTVVTRDHKPQVSDDSAQPYIERFSALFVSQFALDKSNNEKRLSHHHLRKELYLHRNHILHIETDLCFYTFRFFHGLGSHFHCRMHDRGGGGVGTAR